MGLGFSSSETHKVGVMSRLKEDVKLYRLVDMHGGGDLLPWMRSFNQLNIDMYLIILHYRYNNCNGCCLFRYAERSGDHSIVDSYIDVKVLHN